MTCGSAAPPSKASRNPASAQGMHHGAVKAMKAILRAVGSQTVVTGGRPEAGQRRWLESGRARLARSSSSKVSGESWSTVAVQRLLRAKRPSTVLAGPFLVGACARSAVKRRSGQNCRHRTAAVQLGSSARGRWRWWWRWWRRRRLRFAFCQLRSENCPLVQPLWWQQLQLLLWTLCTSSLRCWLSELGYAC